MKIIARNAGLGDGRPTGRDGDSLAGHGLVDNVPYHHLQNPLHMIKMTFAAVSLALCASAMSQTSAQFVAQSRAGLEDQTAAHAATWGLGSSERWKADLEAGTITFSFNDGKTVIAPIQVIGTYNKLDGTFLWGWDHPSVPGPLRRHAELARQWGKKNHLPDYTSRMVKVSEDEAWNFAAVANRLGNANGVYRGPSGTTMVFMSFGEVKMQQATKP
ncbi:DUF6882 domain-containing protein [Massilia sp. CCM 8734]|uniref:DUF6882 domain-containing protein n=1 Tax=Massilia sp. CCM 8734 TaxID=2609283 RepID=UPI0034D2B703